MLVQHPTPPQIDFDAALLEIDPDKDVDGLHPVNMGRLALGMPGPVPCTPAGIEALLAHYEIPVSGREVCILGPRHDARPPAGAAAVAEAADGERRRHRRPHRRAELGRLHPPCRDRHRGRRGARGSCSPSTSRPGATVVGGGRAVRGQAAAARRRRALRGGRRARSRRASAASARRRSRCCSRTRRRRRAAPPRLRTHPRTGVAVGGGVVARTYDRTHDRRRMAGWAQRGAAGGGRARSRAARRRGGCGDGQDPDPDGAGSASAGVRRPTGADPAADLHPAGGGVDDVTSRSAQLRSRGRAARLGRDVPRGGAPSGERARPAPRAR